jgi:uncharacterized glyoxalase superfamily protein PhnB
VQAQLSVRRGRVAVEFYRRAFGAVEIIRFGATAEPGRARPGGDAAGAGVS